MATGKEHRIAVVMGDGIGKEVVPEGMKVVDVAGKRFGYKMSWTEFPWSCEHFHKTGVMMPEDGLETLRKFEAVFLGAVGYPGVPDHVSLWGLLVPIRRGFQQYANVRPVKTMEGMESPLKHIEGGKIDILVVRENTEGEYSNVGGMMFGGTEHEFVVQESVFTRRGVRNVMKYAFDQARRRERKHVTSVTKSNGICITMPYWDELFREMSKEYPDIRTDQYHIDSLCATLVAHPERFDVIVCSNLFGDIVSDLCPALAGSLGIAPSASLNPEREFPSTFEPVHGSAPDIYGRNISNPVAQILTGAMMVEHLGYPEAARTIEKAVEVVMAQKKVRTRDLGGDASTQQMGKAVADLVATL